MITATIEKHLERRERLTEILRTHPMIATADTPTIDTTIDTTPADMRAAAEAALTEAELAIAAAAVAVFAAVKAGSVKPCSCLFGNLGMAQKQIEETRDLLTNHGKTRRSDRDKKQGLEEALLEAMLEKAVKG